MTPIPDTVRRPWRLALALLLALAVVGLVFRVGATLERPAQVALLVFGLALIAWTVLRLDDTPVALAAGAALVLLDAAEPADLYRGLGDPLIWLLLGAFVVSAALAGSGLTERWTRTALAGAGSLHALLHRLNLAVGLTAFIVPSTSARAALLLPLALALLQALPSASARKAVLMLVPTSVLLTACASLLGAGAHLVAVDWMQRLGGPAVGFAQWAIWAAPFAFVSSLLATECIARLYLSRQERRQPLAPVVAAPTDAPLSPHQRAVTAITALTVVGWATSSWHGLEMAVVALLGALAITIKPLTGLDLKAALKKVEWNLLLFLAATLVMGQALLETGAAQALSSGLMSALEVGTGASWPPLSTLSLAALLALLSHLLITSRTARALVLLPTIAIPLAATGADPVLLVMVCAVGSGFCQTLRVSAKPVALFAAAEVDPACAITEKDLWRLSATLLLPLWMLLLAFAGWIWPGMALTLSDKAEGISTEGGSSVCHRNVTERSHEPPPINSITVLIAPSGFKESLGAGEVADHIARGVLRAMPLARVLRAPMVDGGEGFTEALVQATCGSLHRLKVTGPVGEPVDSFFGMLGGREQRTAVIEMAAAAGLRLVPRDRRNPMLTTSYGVGELIRAALDAGASRILLGCGDSGINDGGAGMAQALGARLLDADGQDLPRGGGALARLARIDLAGLDPRLNRVQLDAAVNWHNVLLGERGVARVFGPQKGATPDQVESLAAALDHYASVIQASTGRDVGNAPGSGASGGLGAGFAAMLGGRLHPRYDIVMQYLELDALISQADLVITAEGSLDGQSPYGKIPTEVARRAKRRGLPVVALAGTIGKGVQLNYDHGIDAFASILKKPCTLEEAIANAASWLARAAEDAVHMIGVGLALRDQSRRPRTRMRVRVRDVGTVAAAMFQP